MAEVKRIPSNGKMHLIKFGILSGFLNVVEKDNGFALGVAIICYKDLPWIFFYCVVVETDVVTIYLVGKILFRPRQENIIDCAFMGNQICHPKPNAPSVKLVQIVA